MNIRTSLNGSRLIVSKDKHEANIPIPSKGSFAPHAESILLYRIQQELKARGVDLAKKRMHKDSHLVDDLQMYLRSRNKKCPYALYIHNDRWAVADAAMEFNEYGQTSFHITYNVYGPNSSTLPLPLLPER